VHLAWAIGASAPDHQDAGAQCLRVQLRERQYVVVVTCGLVDSLAADELEAVLAHERTHIRNRDTQLMVIAVIFAGIFALFGDLLVRAGIALTAGARPGAAGACRVPPIPKALART
jgi:Zn-dependent protease with chaperone function